MKIIDEAYINKIKNKLYKCLCEKESGGEWESYLDSILIELYGWEEDRKNINFLCIWYKLTSCRFLDYKYFRKTIFDVMSMLSSDK